MIYFETDRQKSMLWTLFLLLVNCAKLLLERPERQVENHRVR